MPFDVTLFHRVCIYLVDAVAPLLYTPGRPRVVSLLPFSICVQACVCEKQTPSTWVSDVEGEGGIAREALKVNRTVGV